MKRYQIDFAVRELDVPEDQARGVRFSEAVPIDRIFDYLTRVRDAVVTLVGGTRGTGNQTPPAPAVPPLPSGPAPHQRSPEVDRRTWSGKVEPWVHRAAPSEAQWDSELTERIRRGWGVLRASVH